MHASKRRKHDILGDKDSKPGKVEQQESLDVIHGKKAQLEEHKLLNEKDSKRDKVEQQESPDVKDGKQAKADVN